MLTDRERAKIDTLPTAARAKMTRLVAGLEQSFAAARERSGRRQYLLDEIRRENEQIDRALSTYPHANPDDTLIVMARERVAMLKNQVADLDAADSGDDRTAMAAIQRGVMEFLSSVPPGTVPEVAKARTVSLKRGDNPAAAIEARRDSIVELKLRIADVEQAPLPSAVAKALATAQIDRLASAGRPAVDGILSGDLREVKFPEHLGRLEGGEATGYVEGVDALAVLAWLNRDAMIAALHREIDAQADDEHAMTAEQKRAAVAKIEADILALEREECALIDQAADAGMKIAPRGDVSIIAFLRLSGEFAPAPKKVFDNIKNVVRKIVAPASGSIGEDASRREPVL